MGHHRPNNNGPSNMLPFYLGSLALGGVLIAASVIFGDADTDAGVDFDAGIDADGELGIGLDPDQDAIAILSDPGDAVADAGTWLPFFSLRFWTFALAAFGASGSLLTLLGVTGVLGAAVSVVLGGGIGTGAAWTFRQLQQTEVSGNVSMRDLRGTEATVLLAVGPSKMGKVRILMDGQHVDMPARTQCEDTMERDQKALIVSMNEGVAQITPVPFGYTSMAKED